MTVSPSHARLTVVALLSGLAACSPGEQTVRATQAIAGGVADTMHTDVVGIAIIHDTGLGTCSGSLITPTLVLTARHCVSPVDEGGVACSNATIAGVVHTVTRTQDVFPAVAFRVTTDASITFRSRFTTVAEVLTPPGSTRMPLCGNDIALLRLSAPISTVPLIRPRLDLAPSTTELFTASGYGGTTNQGDGAGQRRMRAGLQVRFVGRAVTRGVVVLEDREWLADTGTCRGDSGGPALDELGEVFGVLSRGASTTCDSPIYTRVDSFSDWIREQAARAAEMSGDVPPMWAAVPEERPGALGDGCASAEQCDEALECLPTGAARECTTTDCTACPEGWLCNEEATHCVRDPSLIPPPPIDAGTTPPADAGAPAAVDAGAPATADAGPPLTAAPRTDAADSTCDVATVGGRHGGRGFGLTLLALLGVVCARRAGGQTRRRSHDRS